MSKRILVILNLVLLITVFAGGVFAEMTKTSQGIKAVLKVTEEKSMVDLYLQKAGKAPTPITEAKVKAVVTTPDGKKVEKELIGMWMDGAYSFMNSLDMSRKGKYIFNVAVERGNETVNFEFSHNVK